MRRSDAGAERAEDESPDFWFGDPEIFAIEGSVRGRAGKRVFARASLSLAGRRFGNARETIQLKDFAELIWDSTFGWPDCTGDDLPPALDPSGFLEYVWSRAELELDERETDDDREVDRYIWLEGIETFDGFRSVKRVDGDELEVVWIDVSSPEDVHFARLPLGEVNTVLDEFFDWVQAATRYVLREPKRSRSRRSSEDSARLT